MFGGGPVFRVLPILGRAKGEPRVRGEMAHIGRHDSAVAVRLGVDIFGRN